jgi:hypothetical protein
MVSLPIPIENKKEIEFFYVNEDNKIKPYRMKMDYNVNKDTVKDLIEKVNKKLDKNSKMYLVTLSYTEASELFMEDIKMD